MKYASFLKCPVFGGEVKSANLKEVKSLPGVSDAFIIKGVNAPYILSSGVAVITDSTWRAMRALDTLKVEWDHPDVSEHSTENYAKEAKKIMKNSASYQREKFVDESKVAADGNLEAVYHYPHLAHNTLEPQNCTALFKDGVYEFWAPTQSPRRAMISMEQLFKVKPDQMKIHVTRSGGGFGRRVNSDCICEAAAIAREMEGVPIKLTWSREQDIQHDFYRTSSWHHFTGNIVGNEITFSDHFITMGEDQDKPGIGAQMRNTEFPLPQISGSKFKQTVIPTIVPFGWWRAPGTTQSEG